MTELTTTQQQLLLTWRICYQVYLDAIDNRLEAMEICSKAGVACHNAGFIPFVIQTPDP